MKTLTGVEHEELLRVRDALARTLADAMNRRHLREQQMDGEFGPEHGWVIYERDAMHGTVNAVRRRHGLPPVSVGDVRRVEESADGHVDYAAKYALRCAKLAVGVDPFGHGGER